MPELPEVELVRRKLEPHLVGRTIDTIRTTRKSYFFITPPGRLRHRLRQRTVEGLARHGKYLIAQLDNGERLLLHLGMTGQLRVEAGARAPARDKHTHLLLRFTDGAPQISLRDVRKFGKVQILAPDEACPRLDKLGVDALDAPLELLDSLASRRSVPIKSVLLDQTVLAGVGNIYADEALFQARIQPTRPASELTRIEGRRLIKAVKQVMARAIDVGGSTFDSYVHPDGETGNFQDEHKVYSRSGEPCVACGSAIQRTTIAQRSTHYCPHCQE